MKLSYIVENFRSFVRMEIQDCYNPVAEILTAIFNDVVSLEFRNDAADLLDKNRIALYTLYDFPYASTNCQLHVLAVDDQLVGLAQRHGKSDWQGIVLDQAAMGRVALDLAAAAIRNDLEARSAVDLNDDLGLGGYTLHFLDVAETMFVFREPRYVYRLNEIQERHRAYFVDAAGAAHRVTKIGEFQLRGPLSGLEEGSNMLTIVAGGEELLADATQLLFELIPGRGNLDEALNAYRQPSNWKISRTLPGRRLVVEAQDFGRWNKREVWVEFVSPKAMTEFFNQYSEVKPKGTFTEQLLGSDGAVFNPYAR